MANVPTLGGNIRAVPDADGNLHQVVISPAIPLIGTAAGLSTSAYSAGDAVGTTALSFASAALEAGRGGVIVSAALYCEVAIAGAYELEIFEDTVTAQTDNAAYSHTGSDRQKARGIIKFPTANARTAVNNVTQYADPTSLPWIYSCVGTVLYGQLIATDAFTLTGVSATGIKVILGVSKS